MGGFFFPSSSLLQPNQPSTADPSSSSSRCLITCCQSKRALFFFSFGKRCGAKRTQEKKFCDVSSHVAAVAAAVGVVLAACGVARVPDLPAGKEVPARLPGHAQVGGPARVATWEGMNDGICASKKSGGGVLCVCVCQISPSLFFFLFFFLVPVSQEPHGPARVASRGEGGRQWS